MLLLVVWRIALIGLPCPISSVRAGTARVGLRSPRLRRFRGLGRGANIGAATVFVNYDGVAKHHTTVGDHVRIGSDTMLVAPVTIGDGAYTAAGSVIVSDVPPGAMAVARGQQRNVGGWVGRRRACRSTARRPEPGRSPETRR